MSDRHALRLAIVPRPSDSVFTGLEYWLRLEQITGSDIAKPAEIAEIVDELYGIEACSPEPTPEEEKPPITWERLMEIAERRLDLEECRRLASGTYTARVKMVYSHPNDPNNRPKASVTIGKIISRQMVTEDVSITVSVREQTSTILDYPVPQAAGKDWPGSAKWLGSVFSEESGAIPPPQIVGSGNVLSWGSVATGTILVKVPTVYEIIEIEVPGIPKLGSLKGDSQSTTLRVFWRLQVYEFTVEATTNDTRADGQTLAQICGWDSFTGDGGSGGSSSSGNDSNTTDDTSNQATPTLGCLSQAPKLADPAFYRRVCCHPPAFDLPTCAQFATDLGVQEISEAEQKRIRKSSRGRVEFVAVGPGPDGCGRLITTQQVNPRNCCADVTPMNPHPDNPTSMGSGTSELFRVLDGRDPYESGEWWLWQSSGGLTLANGSTSMRSGKGMTVSSPSDWCDMGTIRVHDGCTILTMTIINADPPEPLTIEGGEYIVAPESYISITAEGGTLPYSWSSDSPDLQLISDPHANPGIFEASADFCGSATVRVSDACTEVFEVDVRSTAGRWVEIEPFDPCDIPGAGSYPDPSGYGQSISGKYLVQVYRGVNLPTYSCADNTGMYCPVGFHVTASFDDWGQSYADYYAPGYSGCSGPPVYSNGCVTIDSRSPPQCLPNPPFYVTIVENVTALYEWRC